MELPILAIVIVIIGWIWWYFTGKAIRGAWKDAANSLGLKFTDNFFLHKTKIEGAVDGRKVSIYYLTNEETDYSESSPQTKREHWPTIVVSSNQKLDFSFKADHSTNSEIKAYNNMVTYPNNRLFCDLDEQSFEFIDTYRDWKDADVIVSNVNQMVAWMKEIVGDGYSGLKER